MITSLRVLKGPQQCVFIVFLDLLCLLRCLYVLQNVLRSMCFTYFSVHPDFVGKCFLEPAPLKFGFNLSLKSHTLFWPKITKNRLNMRSEADLAWEGIFFNILAYFFRFLRDFD